MQPHHVTQDIIAHWVQHLLHSIPVLLVPTTTLQWLETLWIVSLVQEETTVLLMDWLIPLENVHKVYSYLPFLFTDQQRDYNHVIVCTDCIDGVIVEVLALSAVEGGFELQLGQTKDCNIAMQTVVSVS